MQLAKLQKLPSDLPWEIAERFCDCDVYDSSSSPEARVYFLDADEGFFLKIGTEDTLLKEAVMTKYFANLGIGAEVLHYSSEGKDILLTKKINGHDLTSREFLSDPQKMAERMGKELRALHETKAVNCPIPNRTADYLATFEEGYRLNRFDPSYIDKRLNLETADHTRKYILKNAHILKNEVLIHGDFCLPNVIFNGWDLSGYIDLGGSGIGDRHIDLFWGAWTLNFNLGTDKFRGTFFDAYGRELIDEEKLLLISAIEAFG